MKVKSNVGLIAIALVLVIGAPSFMRAMSPDDPVVQVNTNYQLTDSTVNAVMPPGSRLGVGWLTPTVMADIRSDSTVSGDPGLPLSLWRNSQTATGMRAQIVRQRGTIASPTATLVTDGIFRWDIYGVTTTPGLAQGGEIDADQDQASGASAVPMSFTWKAHNTAGSLKQLMHLDSAQHWNAPMSTAPALTSCGGSPTIVGSDVAGTVTIGSAGTGCVITFNTAWNVTNPSYTIHCTVTTRTANATFAYAPAAAAITITGAVAGEVLDYTCIGAS